MDPLEGEPRQRAGAARTECSGRQGAMLTLDGRGPLQRQLFLALRDAISSGALAPGSRLPGSRTLARELGVSRNTVLLALRQLIAEGYASARRGSGTYAASELLRDLPPRATSASAVSSRASTPGVRLSRSARAAARFGFVPSWELGRAPRTIDFRYGDAAYQDLPIATWARLYGRKLRRIGVRDLAYRAPGGHPALREALASYLERARGVHCAAGQVIVTAGSQQAIDLCLRVLVDPGDRVGLEEPHYPGFHLALVHARARIVSIPVDEDGLCVERLARLRALRMVCVTPSHQFPTGALLSASRRIALIEWARERRSYVLEDDYDGEFRYAGKPRGSLQGRDAHQRVLYVGTLSKTMFPALRLGYVVVPDSLREAFLRMKAACDTGSAGIDQQVLAEFIAGGHFERHLRRARLTNAARRSALLAALTEKLGARVRVSAEPAGLYVWLEVLGLPPERAKELGLLAREEGVALHSGAACYLRRPPHATFLLGYTGLSLQQIARGVSALGRALEKLDLPARLA